MAPKQKDSMKYNFRWSPEMDETFLNASLDEMLKGNRPDGTFTTFAYDNILQVLRNSFGPYITKQHLKNQKKTLSQRFGELYDLFHGLSGFSWSPVTKMFEAKNQIWHELIENKPQAKKWMTTPILHYDKLYELFGTDRATGKYAESAKDKVKRWQKECIDLNDYGDDGTMNEIISESEFNWGFEATNSGVNMDSFSPTNANSNHSTGTASSKGHKRKKVMVDNIEDRYEKISLGIKELAEVMRDGNSLQDKSISLSERQVAVAEKQVEIAEKGLSILEKSKPRHYSEEEVWEELEQIGLTDDTKLKCYFFLYNEEKSKRKFFGVPRHLRLQTLIQMMTDAGSSQ